MNGSMSYSNNTVSPTQVNLLMDELNAYCLAAVRKIDSCTNNFFREFNQYWADENAVKFAIDVEKIVLEIIKKLDKFYNEVSKFVYNLHNDYARIAFKPLLSSYRGVSYNSAISHNIVKSTFKDGDSYGIKDDKVLYNVISCFNELKDHLLAIGQTVNDGIYKIPAFGNEAISTMLKNKSFHFFEDLAWQVDQLDLKIASTIRDKVKTYSGISQNLLSNSLPYYFGSNGIYSDNSK